MSDEMRPIVACYKCYRGGEWFETSLESVRPHCVGAVAVMSDQPWKGTPPPHLPENCHAPLARFQSRRPEFRIEVVDLTDRQGTEEQYRAGLERVKEAFGDVGVLLVDTDEVWKYGDLVRLRQAMTADTRSLCFRSGIWTYLRSPLWRVHPQESARVAVALANTSQPTGKSRLSNIYSTYPKNRVADVPCALHHFGYVRLDPEEIVSKLANTATQDTVPTRANWKRRVWDNLPAGRNLHPQTGFDRCWGKVMEVGAQELPRPALESGAFWGGLVWGTAGHPLLTADDPAWRREVEAMPDCPETTVPDDMGPSLARLAMTLLGPAAGAHETSWLLPRLRMSFRETMQLAALASTVPAGGRALEVGSGHGGSMAVLMMSCPAGASLVAVDPYLPYDEENAVLVQGVVEGGPDELAETVRLVERSTGPRNMSLERSPSAEAAKRWPVSSLDLLLVDGNHSWSSCREDLELWWPAVRPGGLVLVHDCAARFPGVVRAIREFEAERGVSFSLPTRSTLAWLRKPASHA